MDLDNFDTSSQYIVDLEIDENMECSNNISVPINIFHDFVTNFSCVDDIYNLILTDQKTGKITYCCMTDMHEEKNLKVPKNVYDNLLCKKDVLVNLSIGPIPKGDLIKIKPCTKDFIDIKMLDKELEKTLSKFTLLSSNQIFTITYRNKKYNFIVTDVFSDNNSPVSVINVANKNIKLDLINPFVDELINDKKKCSDECNNNIPLQFRLTGKIGGVKYDNTKSMTELRKGAYN